MSDERTLAEFLSTLQGTLEKINDRLERLEGQPIQAEVEAESFPDWNEDVPSAPLLRLVTPEPPPTPEKPSALGEAFRSRATAAPPPPPAPGVEKWQAVGDLPAVSETVRGDGHVLTNEEIAAHYRRDQAMRRNPGRTVEEEYAGRL